jgi:hypothetical protein
MVDILRLCTFLAFLALGARVAAASGSKRRRALDQWIAYLLAVNTFVVLTQRDDWPFTHYPLISKRSEPDRVYDKIVFRGVDALGREWDIGPEAWSPVSPPVLMQWFKATYPGLSVNARRQATAFLLDKAEASRRAAIAGHWVGRHLWLGPLAAPDWWLYRPVAAIAPSPYAGVRVYEASFRPEERVLLGTAPRERLLAQYP